MVTIESDLRFAEICKKSMLEQGFKAFELEYRMNGEMAQAIATLLSKQLERQVVLKELFGIPVIVDPNCRRGAIYLKVRA